MPLVTRLRTRSGRICTKAGRVCDCVSGWVGTIGVTCCSPLLLPTRLYQNMNAVGGAKAPLDAFFAGTFALDYVGYGSLFANYHTWASAVTTFCVSGTYGPITLQRFFSIENNFCSPRTDYAQGGTSDLHCFGAGSDTALTFDCATAIGEGFALITAGFFGTDTPNCCGMPSSLWPYNPHYTITPE